MLRSTFIRSFVAAVATGALGLAAMAGGTTPTATAGCCCGADCKCEDCGCSDGKCESCGCDDCQCADCACSSGCCDKTAA
jgi:hypothetical protein